MKTVNTIILTILGIFLIGITAVAGLFYSTGGHSHIISTPSMAQYSPVGTLVLSKPTEYSALKKGDTITFLPPGSKETYFHRIVNVTPEGIKTKGDLNDAVDPWILTSKDITGIEVAHVHNLGFLIHALPFLLVGGVLLWAITRYFIEPKYRYPARIFGTSFILAVAAYFTRPFANAKLISQTVVDGKATTSFVPTGILHLDGEALKGTKVSAVEPGKLAKVVSTYHDAHGHYIATISPHVLPWQWVIFLVILILPTLLCVLHVKYSKYRFNSAEEDSTVVDNSKEDLVEL